MYALRRSARIAGLLGAELAAVVFLVDLGSRPPFVIPFDDLGGWVSGAPPVEAGAAILRVVALAGAGWMLATTLVYVAVAVGLGAGTTGRWARLVLPDIRRVVDRSVAAVVVGAVTVVPSTAAVRDGRAGSAPVATIAPVREPPIATSPPAPHAAPSPGAAPQPGVPAVTPPPNASVVVVVQTGDSLWQLASARLAEVTATPAALLDEHALTGYWTRVCAANHARLRSGDPNLVFPGEQIVLPSP
jgi:nucleoid-associated protein YgaU